MDARDRTEILEAFFWFGQVQSNPKEFTWRPCSIPYNSCEFVYENIDKDCFKGFMVHYFLFFIMKEGLLIFQILNNSNIEMHIHVYVHEVLGFCTQFGKGTKYRSWLLAKYMYSARFS